MLMNKHLTSFNPKPNSTQGCYKVVKKKCKNYIYGET